MQLAIRNSGKQSSRRIGGPAKALGIVLMLLVTASVAYGERRNAAIESEPSVAELRAEGQPAVDRLCRQREQLIGGLGASDAEQREEIARQLAELEHRIDAVAAARDSHISGLYWYTDYEQALAEAQRLQRPLLSLRMMGQLTDEYSCANSRFFRVALYANAEISQYLRDHYVLHWKSVRPVPRITVDFGDGRVLHRTVTGNSIHYVVSPTGEVFDALPGLYSPARFLEYLTRDAGLSRDCFQPSLQASNDYSEEDPQLAALFGQMGATKVVATLNGMLYESLATEFEQNYQLARESLIARGELSEDDGGEDLPDAEEAADLAVTKRMVEIELVRDVLVRRVDRMLDRSGNAEWVEMAQHFLDGARLDEASCAIIERDQSSSCLECEADEGELRLERRIENFERSIALDTAQNEFRFHLTLHRWLAEGESIDIESLNERVYAELFLTPSNDPWVGLFDDEIYTGLTGDGIGLNR